MYKCIHTCIHTFRQKVSRTVSRSGSRFSFWLKALRDVIEARPQAGY